MVYKIKQIRWLREKEKKVLDQFDAFIHQVLLQKVKVTVILRALDNILKENPDLCFALSSRVISLASEKKEENGFLRFLPDQKVTFVSLVTRYEYIDRIR